MGSGPLSAAELPGCHRAPPGSTGQSLGRPRFAGAAIFRFLNRKGALWTDDVRIPIFEHPRRIAFLDPGMQNVPT